MVVGVVGADGGEEGVYVCFEGGGGACGAEVVIGGWGGGDADLDVD